MTVLYQNLIRRALYHKWNRKGKNERPLVMFMHEFFVLNAAELKIGNLVPGFFQSVDLIAQRWFPFVNREVLLGSMIVYASQNDPFHLCPEHGHRGHPFWILYLTRDLKAHAPFLLLQTNYVQSRAQLYQEWRFSSIGLYKQNSQVILTNVQEASEFIA